MPWTIGISTSLSGDIKYHQHNPQHDESNMFSGALPYERNGLLRWWSGVNRSSLSPHDTLLHSCKGGLHWVSLKMPLILQRGSILYLSKPSPKQQRMGKTRIIHSRNSGYGVDKTLPYCEPRLLYVYKSHCLCPLRRNVIGTNKLWYRGP